MGHPQYFGMTRRNDYGRPKATVKWGGLGRFLRFFVVKKLITCKITSFIVMVGYYTSIATDLCKFDVGSTTVTYFFFG